MTSAERNSLTLPAETAIDRAMRVLTVLEQATATGEGGLRLTDVARRAGLPLTTTHRLTRELRRHQLIDATGTNASLMQLGTRLFELGEHVPRKRHLRDAALPFMEDLYEITHDTVQLGVLDGTDVLYIEKIGGHRQARSPSRVGGRVPATCTALGKAMLAFGPREVLDRVLDAGLGVLTPYSIADRGVLRAALAAVKRAGYATDREEAALGLACVAAPVLADGAVVAALSLTMPDRSLDVDRLAPVVRTAARSLGRALE
jgi:DNA-binding IclR family transcriptional regulator